MKKCKHARFQECKNAPIKLKCMIARMQECKIVNIQECKNARTQEWHEYQEFLGGKFFCIIFVLSKDLVGPDGPTDAVKCYSPP